MNYFKAILIAVDQLVNALLGGWPDESLSSRCYRLHIACIRSWPMYLVDTLFFWEDDHCKASYESERLDRHLPPEFRT